ncbi:MAG: hypothetical protein AAFO07_32275 [Bacteroidota bacterium]
MNIDEKYKAIKNILGLDDNDIAQMFGYKDGVSLRNATRFDKIKKGVVELYESIINLLNIEKS